MALLAAAPTNSARAMLLPEDITNLRSPIKASFSLPSSGPITRAGHLADRRVSSYLISASARRTLTAPRDPAPSTTSQLAWIAMLLASVCGAIMVLGRQLPEQLAVRDRGLRRRA